MSQPNMLHYGSGKPQYPIQLNPNQQWGDFTTEARNTRRDQNRERLEKHFEHRGNSGHSYPAPQSHYRDRDLSQGERLHISNVKSATRAALGPRFDFNDETKDRAHRHMENYQFSRGWIDPKDYKVNDIQKKYIDEFNQKWHEDDEDNDADQYLADCAKEAAWRKHTPTDYPIGMISSSYKPCSIRARATTTSAIKRTDSGYGSMSSHSRRSTPERKEGSYQSQRPKTSHRSKSSSRQESSYLSDQSKRPYTSYRAEQARREQGPERPRTPIPGLVSTFSWDVDVDEEPAKKRRGGFFSGLFRRH